MKKLLIVRHGETLWNAEDRIMGHANIGLSEKGIEHAKHLNTILEKENIEHVYCSTSKRALETAEIINKNNLPQTNLDSLKERDQGIFEGMKKKDIKKNYRKLWEAKFMKNPWFSRAEGAESLYEVLCRTILATQEIINHDAKTILIVTHGTPIRLMQFLFTPHKSDYDIFQIETPHTEVLKFLNPKMHLYTTV